MAMEKIAEGTSSRSPALAARIRLSKVKIAEPDSKWTVPRIDDPRK
jgi:hypothetical protein